MARGHSSEVALDPTVESTAPRLQGLALGLRTLICEAKSQNSLPARVFCGVHRVSPWLTPPPPYLGSWTPFTEAECTPGTGTRPSAAAHPLRSPQAQPLSPPSPSAGFWEHRLERQQTPGWRGFSEPALEKEPCCESACPHTGPHVHDDKIEECHMTAPPPPRLREGAVSGRGLVPSERP